MQVEVEPDISARRPNSAQKADAIDSNVILSLRDIYKSFKIGSTNCDNNSKSNDLHEVLSGVDLQINKGEFVTIVGPSGCGKSTLLSIIAGLENPDCGRVLGNSAANSHSTKTIMIFQESALFPWLTVRENVEFGLKIANTPEEKRHAIADQYIALVGLTKFSDFFVHQLSGGMKQRVAIARALAMDPEILLMDEPFAALDVQTRELLNDELVGIHKATGKTIVFVTHNIN